MSVHLGEPRQKHGDTPEQLAAELARLVVTTWARAANHRPMLGRDGKSRVDLFRGPQPTEDDKAKAREALRARQRKQELARQARARRQDLVTRAVLDRAFDRLGLGLGLDDLESHLRISITSWPLAAVVEGIAVFEGKKKAGTLPDGVDARYLRGIVKNSARAGRSPSPSPREPRCSRHDAGAPRWAAGDTLRQSDDPVVCRVVALLDSHAKGLEHEILLRDEETR